MLGICSINSGRCEDLVAFSNVSRSFEWRYLVVQSAFVGINRAFDGQAYS